MVILQRSMLLWLCRKPLYVRFAVLFLLQSELKGGLMNCFRHRGPASSLLRLSVQWQPLSWAETPLSFVTSKLGAGVARSSPSSKVCKKISKHARDLSILTYNHITFWLNSQLPCLPLPAKRVISLFSESEWNCYCASNIDASLNCGFRGIDCTVQECIFYLYTLYSFWVENGWLFQCHSSKSWWREASHLCNSAGWIKQLLEATIDTFKNAAAFSVLGARAELGHLGCWHPTPPLSMSLHLQPPGLSF